MTKKIAIYAGSFDPPTNGHLWMIFNGALLFDELIVAVGVNPFKKCNFSLDDRVKMLKAITVNIAPKVTIDVFDNEFLVDYATQMSAQYILRGIRNQADYEYETAMRHVNSDFCPEITTVFLMTPRDKAEVSSSLVNGLIGPKGWQEKVKKYVPAAVFNFLLEKHNTT